MRLKSACLSAFLTFRRTTLHKSAVTASADSLFPRARELRIEANASKRGQRLLADYAEREHFRAREAWSIEN